MVAISSYFVMAAFWLITPLALAAYFFTRRGLRRSPKLVAYDSVVILIGAVAFVAIFWQTFTREAAYEERLWGYYTIPLALSLVFVPLLLIAGLLRYCIFSQSPESKNGD
jgi:NADH:ubiquinone oxidoreductase subunit 6 (subunit J)